MKKLLRAGLCAGLLLATTTASAAVVINEGFDYTTVLGGGIDAAGWVRQNNSEQAGYTFSGGTGNPNFGAHDGPIGSFVSASGSSSLANDVTLSNWLLTPPIEFGAGSTVSFYTRSGGGMPNFEGAARLQVRACLGTSCTRLGTNAEDVGDFTTLLLDVNPDETPAAYPGEWTPFVLDGADGVPASGSGRIAFRYFVHHSAGFTNDYAAIDRVVVDNGDGGDSPLDLAVTVAPADPAHPDACGNATAIEVSVGDQVNLCYRVTNRSPETLRYHGLRDDRYGTIFNQRPRNVEPQASYQYNRVITVGESQSPTSTWTAHVDPWGYVYDDGLPGEFIDATDGTLIPYNDGLPVDIPFPADDFDFEFFGSPITKFCAQPSGVFQAVRETCSYNQGGIQPLPVDGYINNPAMALFWADMWEEEGEIYYKMLGTAPNRRFVVEWYQFPFCCDTAGGLTAEIVLNEGSNVVEFLYDNVLFGQSGFFDYGEAAGIGLQNQFLANSYSYNTPSLMGVTRIAWTPANATAYTNTRQVQIEANAAVLQLNPETLNASVPSRGATTQTLEIGNAGSGRLDWTIDTAEGNGHFPRTPHFVSPLGDPDQVSIGRKPAAAALSPPTRKAFPMPNGENPRIVRGVDLIEGPYVIRFDPAHPDYVYPDGADIVAYAFNTFLAGGDFLDGDFDKFYAFDTSTSRLLWYDLSVPLQPTTSIHVVGTTPLPVNQVTGLRQDPSTGAVYVSVVGEIGGELWRIDPATAAVQFVADVPDAPTLIDIAFDAQGHLYGVDITLDALLAIDKHTGASEPIGSLGFNANYASGLAMDYATGVLYFTSVDTGAGQSGLWTIDTTTGQASFVAPIIGIDGFNQAQFDALAIPHASGDPCTDPGTLPWLSLGSLGGIIPAGGDADTVGVRFDASALDDGVYTANLCVRSNDPLQRHRTLPISLSVGAMDALFADGFDGR